MAHTGNRVISLLFLDHGTGRGEGSTSRPGRSLLPGNTRYPFYRRLGGPQGRSGQLREISPPPGFDPRIFRPITSRYTDWATGLTCNGIDMSNYWGTVTAGDFSVLLRCCRTHQQDNGVLSAPANSISGPRFSVFTADSYPDTAFQQTAKRYPFKFLLFACQDPPSLSDIWRQQLIDRLRPYKF